MDKNEERKQQNSTENLLMFTGMAFLVAGPVFFFLMQMAINARQFSPGEDMLYLLEFVELCGALLLTVSGAMLIVSGWMLAALNAWRGLHGGEGVRTED
ncbi:hypothetical protein [Entomohabitans teleogrylli]|uniref:hypothetical protein n=1 Tax=Entomohabitans teleogrylli TaxID=1384589 RepID=UPI00073D30B7|nr:hypothetical protein [Entomohabitans teleogrylli]